MNKALLVGAAMLAACASQPKPVSATPPPPPVSRPEPVSPAKASEADFNVQGELGTLDPAQLEAAFQTRSAEVNACYQKGVEKHAWLGGVLELKVRVKADGATEFASVQKPLGDLDVERCVLAAARQIKFPAPKGNAEAEFTYSFTFRGKATLKEWANEQVNEVFAAHRTALDACVRKGLTGGVPRSLRIALFVVPGGTVPAVGVGADGPIDEAWARCAAQEIATWKFEDPRGTVAHVEYQF